MGGNFGQESVTIGEVPYGGFWLGTLNWGEERKSENVSAEYRKKTMSQMRFSVQGRPQ